MTGKIAEEERPGKMLVCSHCPKEFRYNSEKIRHEMSHSPGFECQVCSKKFSFVSALRRHQKQHERTGSVRCEECNRKFRDEVLLKRHIKYAHKGTFSCTKCKATFNSDQALKTHMKTHKPESERRFKCSFHDCNKSFNFSHHLKHHELTHTNDKQHFCAVCGKGFIQSHHLKTHLKTHDPSEWLCCEVEGCSKKFSTEYARKRHMATHKIKPDSGISSDSNSSEAFISKEYEKDSILCASCGEYIPGTEYTKHSIKCEEHLENSTTFESCPSDLQDFDQVLSLDSWKTSDDIKSEINFDEEDEVWTPNELVKEIISKPIFDREIGDCKTAPGGCIMGPEHCVCIERPITDNYDFKPIGVDVERENINDFNLANVNNNVLKDVKRNECEGCDCSRKCSKDLNNDVPNIELRIDGVIKLRDTFDLIPVREVKVNRDVKDATFTCKDVVGNCLAGGIEGCLCAKMMMDDQQDMAQEIQDLTPIPKTEC